MPRKFGAIASPLRQQIHLLSLNQPRKFE
ncbi:hypothetical protein [Leptolyngbya sp. FACHB-671]